MSSENSSSSTPLFLDRVDIDYDPRIDTDRKIVTLHSENGMTYRAEVRTVSTAMPSHINEVGFWLNGNIVEMFSRGVRVGDALVIESEQTRALPNPPINPTHFADWAGMRIPLFSAPSTPSTRDSFHEQDEPSIGYSPGDDGTVRIQLFENNLNIGIFDIPRLEDGQLQVLASGRFRIQVQRQGCDITFNLTDTVNNTWGQYHRIVNMYPEDLVTIRGYSATIPTPVEAFNEILGYYNAGRTQFEDHIMGTFIDEVGDEINVALQPPNPAPLTAEQVGITRYDDEYPHDMECACCESEIDQPENLGEFLGPKETKRYIDYCKESGQQPMLYCCHCFGIMQKSPDAFEMYQALRNTWKKVCQHEDKLEGDMEVLSEQKRHMTQALMKQYDTFMKMREELEVPKKTLQKALAKKEEEILKLKADYESIIAKLESQISRQKISDLLLEINPIARLLREKHAH